MSGYKVFFWSVFSHTGLKTEVDSIILRIQSQYGQQVFKRFEGKMPQMITL